MLSKRALSLVFAIMSEMAILQQLPPPFIMSRVTEGGD